MRYAAPRAIVPTDDLSTFDCGEPDLNDWLIRRALTNHAGGATRTFVTLPGDHVVGFYALSSASVMRNRAPSKVRQNPPEAVPVVLLARLGVDRNHQA